jgi:hypothetical protein
MVATETVPEDVQKCDAVTRTKHRPLQKSPSGEAECANREVQRWCVDYGEPRSCESCGIRQLAAYLASNFGPHKPPTTSKNGIPPPATAPSANASNRGACHARLK